MALALFKDTAFTTTRAFWLAALVVLGSNVALVQLHQHWVTGPVPAWPIAVDLLLVMPIAYLVVHRRMGLKAWLGALALASLGWLAGRLMLPDESRTLWDRAGELRWWLTGLLLAVEGGVILLLLRQLVRLRHTPNLELAIDGVIRERLGDGTAARLVRTELRMWLYALHPRPVRAAFPGQSHFFGANQQANASTQLAFLWVMGFELPLMHGILHLLFNATTAWVVTALSLYGFAYLLAEYRATRLRPVSIDADILHVRYGVLGDVRVPLGAVARVEPWSGEARRASGQLRFVGMGAANVRIVLHEGTRLPLLTGEREIGELLMGLDEPRDFIHQVDARRLACTTTGEDAPRGA